MKGCNFPAHSTCFSKWLTFRIHPWLSIHDPPFIICFSCKRTEQNNPTLCMFFFPLINSVASGITWCPALSILNGKQHSSIYLEGHFVPVTLYFKESTLNAVTSWHQLNVWRSCKHTLSRGQVIVVSRTLPPACLPLLSAMNPHERVVIPQGFRLPSNHLLYPSPFSNIMGSHLEWNTILHSSISPSGVHCRSP